MTRIFLYDVYVFELHLKKDAMKSIPPNMIPNFLPEDILDEIASTPIVEYIKECKNKNQYKLPTNEFLRHHMIGKYFAYQKKQNLEMIEEAEKHTDELLYNAPELFDGYHIKNCLFCSLSDLFFKNYLGALIFKTREYILQSDHLHIFAFVAGALF